MMTLDGLELDNSPIFRRVIQTVCDLSRRPLTGLRILDLGSAHGAYSIELAGRGAQVLGIEAREAWLEQARHMARKSSYSNVEFVRDDVRNLSREKYGEFDIVLCLGILYHLDAPDVFEFMAKISEVCRDFAVFETRLATAPDVSHEWREQQYWGVSAYEHPPGTSAEDKLKNLGASIDNEHAFWFTRASLCNILRDVGFTSVYDCLNPMAYLSVGVEKEFKLWRTRITLAAIKGRLVSLSAGPELPWPEDPEEHSFERLLEERSNNNSDARARRVARRIFSSLKRRL
jgi:Methyltransferase domain